MQNIFDYDLNTKCYQEKSDLSSIDKLNGIRLNSLDLIDHKLRKVKAPFIILKPLVESQNTCELLDYFQNSIALWMFRHYKDVAASNLKLFGQKNGINDIRPIVNNEPENWRSEKTSRQVREIISNYFSETMNPYDAAVLFWYARNSLYFDLDLDKNPKVLICKYTDFVNYPEKVVKKIYEKSGYIFTGQDINKYVHTKSLKKGRNIELSMGVESLAQNLLDKLETAYQAQNSSYWKLS